MYNVQKETISLWQIFVLILIFTLGTTVVVGGGAESKQDFWLTELIVMFMGAVFVWFYYFIVSKGKNLYEIIEETCGKMLGKVITFAYVIYFFYICTRNVRDLGEMIKITILKVTPLEVVVITLMFVVLYIIIQGIEVLARVTELFTPFMIICLLLVFFLIILSGEFNADNLQPFLAEGFSPLFKDIFPLRITFPYGELVVFTVVITSVSNLKYVGKVSVVSVLIAGVLIALSQLVQIAAVGEDIKNRTVFPLLSASREIFVLEFFERVDILVVFILMLGIIIKVSVFFYAGLKGLESMFKIPYRTYVIPISMSIPLFSVLNADNIFEHFEEGLEVVPYVLHLPFQFAIPIVLFLLTLLKNRKNKKGIEGENH
ncbi:hypothetical protein BKP37_14275 [Anaerobacillus alkalilacustris]|uniref:Uncharacterized protein n=1 Tax=Anaerobacillus alkalilacustris TaxID=393763 RepID=A0A1S2LIA0_9BACI|nr:endospore germination permease [Anaerobacillus alkalilacustris]OIJ12242.1 hypothetical protein BKP37_14275 [Anaerobacillus alkalilacustris]